MVTPEKQVFSTGQFFLPGVARPYHDWKPGGHGWVNIYGALEQSVNTYFYQLALDMGIDDMHDFLSRFGFGGRTGVDLLGEIPGVLPSRQWKRGQFGQPWYPGETVIAGIGQGFIVTTPLQLATALAALVNGGARFAPRLLFASKSAGGGQAQRLKAPVVQQIPVDDPANWDIVREGMRRVVHGEKGTARRIKPESGYQIAGKERHHATGGTGRWRQAESIANGSAPAPQCPVHRLCSFYPSGNRGGRCGRTWWRGIKRSGAGGASRDRFLAEPGTVEMKRILPGWVKWPQLDFPLLLSLLLLMGFGLLVLYSASGQEMPMVYRQATRIAMGLAIMLMLSQVPPHILRLWTPWLYTLGMVLLLATWFFGVGRSTSRWLDLGLFRFQPSEIMKLGIPMMVAWYLHPRRLPPDLITMLVSIAIILAPVLLIARQPDLGTALLVAASGGL